MKIKLMKKKQCRSEEDFRCRNGLSLLKRWRWHASLGPTSKSCDVGSARDISVFYSQITLYLCKVHRGGANKHFRFVLPLILMKIILTWASLNPPRSSMGRGKMIVLFFSAEIECSVCKYLEGLSFFLSCMELPILSLWHNNINLLAIFRITI